MSISRISGIDILPEMGVQIVYGSTSSEFMLAAEFE